jgi:hypothetical protein
MKAQLLDMIADHELAYGQQRNSDFELLRTCLDEAALKSQSDHLSLHYMKQKIYHFEYFPTLSYHF